MPDRTSCGIVSAGSCVTDPFLMTACHMTSSPIVTLRRLWGVLATECCLHTAVAVSRYDTEPLHCIRSPKGSMKHSLQLSHRDLTHQVQRFTKTWDLFHISRAQDKPLEIERFLKHTHTKQQTKTNLDGDWRNLKSVTPLQAEVLFLHC